MGPLTNLGPKALKVKEITSRFFVPKNEILYSKLQSEDDQLKAFFQKKRYCEM